MKRLPWERPPLWEIRADRAAGELGFSSSRALKMQTWGGESRRPTCLGAACRGQHSHPSVVRTSMCTRSASLSSPATDLGKEGRQKLSDHRRQTHMGSTQGDYWESHFLKKAGPVPWEPTDDGHWRAPAVWLASSSCHL